MKGNKLVLVCVLVTIIGIILAGTAFVMGARVYGVGFGGNGLVVNSNDNSSRSMKQYVEEKKELESFKSLDLDIAFADLCVQEADHFGIEYRVQADRDIIEEWQGDKLVIKQKNPIGNISFFQMGNLTFSDLQQNSYVIISIPKGQEFDDLKLCVDAAEVDLCDLKANQLTVINSFGDIEVSKLDMNTLAIDAESGDIILSDVQATTANMDTSFGNITIGNMKVEGDFICSVDSGNINLGNTEAKKIVASTTFGSITGSNVTAQDILLDGESSECVIDDISGNRIEANSTFGGIKLGLREKVDAYSVETDVEFGDIEINNKEMGDKYNNTISGSQNVLKITCDSGDIILYDALSK